MSAGYYKTVPIDIIQNLLYRKDLLTRCHADPSDRATVMEICRRDPLYWMNVFCISEGTRVVTNRGIVPIQNVKDTDLVWDGESFVGHQGVLNVGLKDTIHAYGIDLTPDHKVWTKYGWKEASLGYDRETIREPVGYRSSRELQKRAGQMELPLRLWNENDCFGMQSTERQTDGLRLFAGRDSHPRKDRDQDFQYLEFDVAALLQQEFSFISGLRRQGDRSVRQVAQLRELLCGHGAPTRGSSDNRSNEQRWELLSRKLPVGVVQGSSEQQKGQCFYPHFKGQDDYRTSSKRGWGVKENDRVSCANWGYWGDDVSEKNQKKKTCYDIVNCGPNQAFAVVDKNGEMLLVHNCWCYEPRPRFNAAGIRMPNRIPFIAWEHQAPAIIEIYESLGKSDIGVEKSRGEGMSWICVLLAMHQFIFEPMTAIGLVSKDEVSVDDPNDPDSLMWKCDYILEKLPAWMSGVLGKDYDRHVTKHTLSNKRNGSSISGFAATANVASGGRKTFFVMDELAKFPRPADKEAMASTQHVTECRLIVSTPRGDSGAYYEVMHEPSSMVRVILDWKTNPTRNRGLYELKGGEAVALDPENNPLPEDYNPPSQDVLDMWSRLRRKGFKLEKRERSPWYDKECDRPGATPQNIAQELDRDYGGSAYRVFGSAFVERVEDAKIAPVHVGDIDFNREGIENPRFDSVDGGPLQLWVPLDSMGLPPASEYVFGCDVSSGTGGSFTSNSTIVGFDLRTGEQVLEFAQNTLVPAEFADVTIALCKLFHNAYLGWEHNGPGAGYTKRILAQGYENIYHRTSQSRRGWKKTKEAGWWTDERTKEVMFSELQAGVVMAEFKLRSGVLLQECTRYVRKEGKITHALVKNAAEDSRGASHGDRVIAACVAVQAARDRPLGSREEDEESAPLGTMARRQHEYEETLREDPDGWDDSPVFGAAL